MNVKKITLKSGKNKITGSITLSGSKSISNRVLIMKAFSRKNPQISGLSNSDDTLRLQMYLNRIETCRNSDIPLIVDANNAGTVLRFLTAFLAFGEGRWLITGNERMQKRPVSELVTALRDLGANISYANNDGFPPLNIISTRLRGGEVNIDASKSSQFVSALMMIAPALKNGLKIKLHKKIVSEPYINMTASLMQLFGVKVEFSKQNINIPSSVYSIPDYTVESDWSSASYWYEVAALNDGSEIKISNLFENSIQGDASICEVFECLGVITDFLPEGKVIIKNNGNAVDEINFDATNCPDLVPAIMATCFGKGVKLNLTGYSHLKYKESDRLNSMLTELTKLGCKYSYKGKTLIVEGELKKKSVDFNTYGDHRIAMSLAPLCSKLDLISIDNKDVVVKSYPEFWNDMMNLNVLTIS